MSQYVYSFEEVNFVFDIFAVLEYFFIVLLIAYYRYYLISKNSILGMSEF